MAEPEDELLRRIDALEARVRELEDERAMYEGITRFQGKERLREFITDPHAHHKPGFYGRSMHLTGNNVATVVDGDRATVSSYSRTMQATDDPASEGAGHIRSIANNHWEMRRVGGQWRIALRRRSEVGGVEYTTNLDGGPT